MCMTMECDGRCAKPKVHYTMGYRTQAAKFEALEERLQRIELIVSLLAREQVPGYADAIAHVARGDIG